MRQRLLPSGEQACLPDASGGAREIADATRGLDAGTLAARDSSAAASVNAAHRCGSEPLQAAAHDGALAVDGDMERNRSVRRRERRGSAAHRQLDRSHSKVGTAPENRRGWDGEYGRLERLDVDPINHPYRVDEQRNPLDVFNTHQQVVITSRESYALILTATTGIIVALIGRAVQAAIYFLAGLRNTHVEQLLLSWPGSRVSLAAPLTKPFLFFALWNGGFALAGGLMTAVPEPHTAMSIVREVSRPLSRAVTAVPHAQVIEPHTAADGVAEIKALINGTHVKHFLRLRTIIVRVLSTIFAAASGLAAGSEAPLIHIGAGVGSGLTRGDKMRNNVLFEFSPAILGLFHNDKDRRLFVSAGAAAGMAVAFGSPIGGVLWVLEETASAWTPALIWRMFTASLVASVTFAFLRAGHSAGDISVSGLLSLGGAHASEPVSLAQVCARNGMSG